MKNRAWELRGWIYARYDNEAVFARHLGWSRQRLNKIMNKEKAPSLDEVKVIANALDRSIEEVARVFLAS